MRKFQVPWTTQPPYFVGAANSNSISAGLVYLWNAAGGGTILTDAVRGSKLVVGSADNAGTVSIVPAPSGRALALDGSSNFHVDRVGTYIATNRANHTMLAVFRTNTASKWQACMQLGELTDSNYGSALGITSTGFLSWGSGLSSSEGGMTLPGRYSSLAVSTNQTYCGAVAIDSTNAYYALDGVTETKSQSEANNACAGGFGIGAAWLNGSVVSGSRFSGNLYALAVWTRTLSSAELAYITRNPWQLFAPISRPLFAQIASGGNTIAVPAGNLSLTGNIPVVIVTANNTLAVPSGSLSLTGYAPGVVINNIIQVPAAGLTLTSYAPTVLTPNTVQVPAGALVLTGYAPTVSSNANNTIQVPAGALLITGYIPTVGLTANNTIEVPLGSLVLSAYAPNVISGNFVTLKAGSWIRYRII